MNSIENVPRPTVLSLNIRDRAGLYAAYMSWVQGGGIFVPTATQTSNFGMTANRPYRLGDEVYLILSLMEDAQRFQVAGKVVWVTPPNAQNKKTQGIGVRLPNDTAGLALKQRIEETLGNALRSGRQTHTL